MESPRQAVCQGACPCHGPKELAAELTSPAQQDEAPAMPLGCIAGARRLGDHHSLQSSHVPASPGLWAQGTPSCTQIRAAVKPPGTHRPPLCTARCCPGRSAACRAACATQLLSEELSTFRGAEAKNTFPAQHWRVLQAQQSPPFCPGRDRALATAPGQRRRALHPP